jgi:uncharacterized delta-60 repeat protein
VVGSADVTNVNISCASLGAITKIGANGSGARGVAIQADGKIVVAGVAITGNSDTDVALVRYHSNGTLDTSFGGTGVITRNISGRIASTDWVRGVAIQSDGKIVLVGYTQRQGDVSIGLAILRYHSDGRIDTGFAGSGILVSTHPTKDKLGHTIAIQADGKIIVGGAVNCIDRASGEYCTLLERYNDDGSLDTTFNGPSASRADFNTRGVAGLTLQTDGKILVAGSKNSGNGEELAVARYQSTGQSDSGFGNAGLVVVPIGLDVGSSNYGTGISLQTDGKIVVSGVAHTNLENNHFSITRLLASGAVDFDFGNAGSVVTKVALPPESDYSYAVVAQPDGKIIVVGESTVPRINTLPFPGFYSRANINCAVVRYNSLGGLDASFGGSGMVSIDLNNLDDRCYGVALQTNGSIVLIGASVRYDDSRSDAYSSFAVIRLNSNGSLDNDFGSSN